MQIMISCPTIQEKMQVRYQEYKFNLCDWTNEEMSEEDSNFLQALGAGPKKGHEIQVKDGKADPKPSELEAESSLITD